MQPFLIFCMPRTGSTTLVEVLNTYQGVKCINEPFNCALHPGYGNQVVDRQSLGHVFSEIWAAYNGIKHAVPLYGRGPFPSAVHGFNILDCIDCNVILLGRRNLLKRAISQELAYQSGIWHFRNEAALGDRRQHIFDPVDIERLRAMLDEVSRFPARSKDRLTVNRLRYQEHFYEDLFGKGDAHHERFAQLERLTSFLGLPGFDRDRIEEVLKNRDTRADSVNAYHQIPNIRDVELELGCDRTGWLFK